MLVNAKKGRSRLLMWSETPKHIANHSKSTRSRFPFILPINKACLTPSFFSLCLIFEKYTTQQLITHGIFKNKRIFLVTIVGYGCCIMTPRFWIWLGSLSLEVAWTHVFLCVLNWCFSFLLLSKHFKLPACVHANVNGWSALSGIWLTGNLPGVFPASISTELVILWNH